MFSKVMPVKLWLISSAILAVVLCFCDTGQNSPSHQQLALFWLLACVQEIPPSPGESGIWPQEESETNVGLRAAGDSLVIYHNGYGEAYSQEQTMIKIAHFNPAATNQTIGSSQASSGTVVLSLEIQPDSLIFSGCVNVGTDSQQCDVYRFASYDGELPLARWPQELAAVDTSASLVEFFGSMF
jgi:hypothetical protein